MATKAEIVAELDRLGVDHDPKARKGDLEELLEASAPATEPTTIEPGGIDPRLVEIRDAARDVEARTRVGRVRPTPVGLDERLVEQRDRQAKADAERANRPATEPPAR